MGLKPDEFWGLTIQDFAAIVEGYNERAEDEMERIAWAVAHIIAPHLQKPVSPRQLLGKELSGQAAIEALKNMKLPEA